LAGSVSADDDIRHGRLIKVCDLTFPINFSYYFACHESRLASPQVRAFHKWLLEESAWNRTWIQDKSIDKVRILLISRNWY